MTKSELIGLLMQKNNSLSLKHIEEAVKAILEQMSNVLKCEDLVVFLYTVANLDLGEILKRENRFN